MIGPLVTLEDIAVTEGRRKILRDVSMRVSPKEIVTILGPNGSGKTTLLRVLVGARRPSAGAVRRAPGLRIGYMPQKLAIDRSMPITVGRFLSLGTLPRGASRRPGFPGTPAEALERLGIERLAKAQLTALSGGEMQRALLARALLRAPDLLAMDEPTQGLDQPGEAAFYELIAEIRAETGAAVLMVSHDIHVVMGASDRVICLNGHVCCEGAPTQVSAMPAYRALFGHGTRGALALYRHEHDHSHDHDARDVG